MRFRFEKAGALSLAFPTKTPKHAFAKLNNGGIFMRILLALVMVLSASSALAAGCDKYIRNERLTTAIKTVAKHTQWGYQEMCNHPMILDVEATPTHTIELVNGEYEEIPHTRVQLHRAEDSCLYMVRDASQTITSSRCYSGF